jgi:hypothetical protein
MTMHGNIFVCHSLNPISSQCLEYTDWLCRVLIFYPYICKTAHLDIFVLCNNISFSPVQTKIHILCFIQLDVCYPRWPNDICEQWNTYTPSLSLSLTHTHTHTTHTCTHKLLVEKPIKKKKNYKHANIEERIFTVLTKWNGKHWGVGLSPVLGLLPSKCEALFSNPNTTHKKSKGRIEWLPWSAPCAALTWAETALCIPQMYTVAMYQ